MNFIFCEYFFSESELEFSTRHPEKKNIIKKASIIFFILIINYDKNLGKVILNNKLINSFALKGQKWDSMLRKSKFSKSEDYPYLGDSRWYDFGKFHKGKICFQDHPGEVSFKNVRVREIK